ncbi:MAG: type II secretion system F family protein [Candidatus Aenigmatarchaeota archaeon]|nr:type II secretion system F family protein [Candidatus Aenigmarchaeota archaeon]
MHRISKIEATLGDIGVKYLPNYFKPLEEIIRIANIGILFERYVGRMIFISIIAFLTSFFTISLGLFFILKLQALYSIIGGFLIGISLASLIITIFHSYPYQILTQKRNSIEANLPFALMHMSAIAASGVPPTTMFKLISETEEYGKVSEEAKMIMRNIETFGMDPKTAIKQVADRTPSDSFRHFLYSFISTIETGGDMRKFLENIAKEAINDYRLKREKYLQALATYADIYTGILIAAPLFFISILSIIGMLGGTIAGLTISDAMRLGIYAFVPLLNIVFILFLHLTQPQV